MSASERRRTLGRPEDWEITLLAGSSELPSDDYWIGNPIPWMPGALSKRFIDFMAGTGHEDTFASMGGFPMYCRFTLGPTGVYYVRAPLIHAPGRRERETREITLKHSYMACLPITALTRLTGLGDPGLLLGNAGFSAASSFRPRYVGTDYIFSTSPPVAATAAWRFRPGEDPGEYLEAAVRRMLDGSIDLRRSTMEIEGPKGAS